MVKNGLNKAETLNKKIKEKVPEATASHLIKKTVILNKDMNEVTTEDDIAEAISKATELGQRELEVRALSSSSRWKTKCHFKNT